MKHVRDACTAERKGRTASEVKRSAKGRGGGRHRRVARTEEVDGVITHALDVQDGRFVAITVAVVRRGEHGEDRRIQVPGGIR